MGKTKYNPGPVEAIVDTVVNISKAIKKSTKKEKEHTYTEPHMDEVYPGVKRMKPKKRKDLFNK